MKRSGDVSPYEAARQMAVPIAITWSPPHRLDWDFVVERHKAICYNKGRQVVRY